MDLKKIKELIKIVEETGITGLSIEEGDAKVEIKKQYDVIQTVAANSVDQSVSSVSTSAPVDIAAAPTVALDDAGLTAIESPMTGTFYASASPDSDVYVKVGDKITKGQVVCIVEAMKTFNEIESEISGTVEKIMVNDKDPVEHGQVLILIRE